MSTKPTISSPLHLTQKRGVLRGALNITFPPNTATEAQEALTQALLALLIPEHSQTPRQNSEICGKALHLKPCFLLYDGIAPPPSPEANLIALNITAPDAKERLAQTLTILHEQEKAAEEEADATLPYGLDPNGPKATKLAQQSAMIKDDDGNSLLSKEEYIPRESYNANAVTLQEVKAHTSGQIAEKALMRLGITESGKADPNGRWLWEQEYAYVISNDALQNKTVGRWFRDICVVCGVSTNTLGKLTNLSQSQWGTIQNEKEPDPSKDILLALRHVLKIDTHCGQSNKGFNLPKGISLLDSVVTRYPPTTPCT